MAKTSPPSPQSASTRLLESPARQALAGGYGEQVKGEEIRLAPERKNALSDNSVRIILGENDPGCIRLIRW